MRGACRRAPRAPSAVFFIVLPCGVPVGVFFCVYGCGLWPFFLPAPPCLRSAGALPGSRFARFCGGGARWGLRRQVRRNPWIVVLVPFGVTIVSVAWVGAVPSFLRFVSARSAHWIAKSGVYCSVHVIAVLVSSFHSS